MPSPDFDFELDEPDELDFEPDDFDCPRGAAFDPEEELPPRGAAFCGTAFWLCDDDPDDGEPRLGSARLEPESRPEGRASLRC